MIGVKGQPSPQNKSYNGDRKKAGMRYGRHRALKLQIYLTDQPTTKNWWSFIGRIGRLCVVWSETFINKQTGMSRWFQTPSNPSIHSNSSIYDIINLHLTAIYPSIHLSIYSYILSPFTLSSNTLHAFLVPLYYLPLSTPVIWFTGSCFLSLIKLIHLFLHSSSGLLPLFSPRLGNPSRL